MGVVGEAKKEENALIMEARTRKRKANYSEYFNQNIDNSSLKDSAAEIDSKESSSDDDLVASEGYVQERAAWGTVEIDNKETAVAWEKEDVERVVSHIQSYGYHGEESMKVNQTVVITTTINHPPAEVSCAKYA